MTRRRLLADHEIAELVAARPRWRHEGDRLVAVFDFADFTAAFAWMTAVALISQRLDHHPDWSNSWNHVEVRLSTHSAGGVTELDRTWVDAVEVLDLTPRT